MGYKKLKNTILITKNIINYYVKPGHIVLDCTVGNGNDTLLLAQNAGTKGKVYGFDIQDAAINNTSELLRQYELLNNVILIKDSHEYIEQYIHEELDFIIYNLGYLPGGDKTIKTSSLSTIKSIRQALDLLKVNGLLAVTVYVGHDGGLEEKKSLEDYLLNLNQDIFHVLKHKFINQKNNPPILYLVEKASV